MSVSSFIDDTLLGNSGKTTDEALRNPITAFNFVLEVELVYFLALKSVRVFNKENEYEYIREGGVNDYVHMRRKPISKPFTFQIERYVGNERFLDPLALGTELVAPLVLYVYRYQPRQGITESAPTWPARLYTFTGCTVTNKEYGELNSEKSGLLTETTTIAYRELVVVTNPTWGPGTEKERMEKFEWGKNGIATKPKYASTLNFKSEEEYEQTSIKDLEGKSIKVTSRKKKDGANPELVKEPQTYGSTEPKWSRDLNVKGDKNIYDVAEATEKIPVKHRVRKDTSQYNKPYIEDFTEDTMPKYAKDDGVAGNAYWYSRGEEDPETGVKYRERTDDGGKTTKRPRTYEEYTKDPVPEWASKKNVEKDADLYSKSPDKDGVQHIVRAEDGRKYTKRGRTYEEYTRDAAPQWGSDVNYKAGYKDYTTTTDMDGTKHTVRTPDGGKYTKPGKTYEEYTKDTTPTYANKTNTENDVDLYTLTPDKDGVNHLVRNPDDGVYTKERWDIKQNKVNPKPSHSKPSPVDDKKPKVKEPWDIKQNKVNPKPSHSKPSPVDDKKPKVKEPWDIRQNKVNPKPKHSKPSAKDGEKPVAKEPWSIKDNKENPKPSHSKPSPVDDKKPEVKGPWSIKNPDGDKQAAQSPVDSSKPEQKGPWNIKSPGSGKSATASPKDSSKPEQKGPWNIKSPDGNKSAKASPKDSSKPEVKGPWDIKQNRENPKPQFATESPKDHEKPEAAKWPPTRRALMAQTLSDKGK